MVTEILGKLPLTSVLKNIHSANYCQNITNMFYKKKKTCLAVWNEGSTLMSPSDVIPYINFLSYTLKGENIEIMNKNETFH